MRAHYPLSRPDCKSTPCSSRRSRRRPQRSHRPLSPLPSRPPSSPSRPRRATRPSPGPGPCTRRVWCKCA
ncbi:MAG: hypothetical protein FJ222_09565 [Lentisphaerae bacterium]|nr:hypothetical protein [Lentisphaerota bacterium]